jgi:hypothetical protein
MVRDVPSLDPSVLWVCHFPEHRLGLSHLLVCCPPRKSTSTAFSLESRLQSLLAIGPGCASPLTLTSRWPAESSASLLTHRVLPGWECAIPADPGPREDSTGVMRSAPVSQDRPASTEALCLMADTSIPGVTSDLPGDLGGQREPRAWEPEVAACSPQPRPWYCWLLPSGLPCFLPPQEVKKGNS